MSSRSRRRAASATCASRESASQLLARVDAELLVDVAQVVLDGLRAQKDRRRGLARRPALREQLRYLQLLRGELVQRAGIAPPGGLPGRSQLGVGLVGPAAGAQALERLKRGPQLFACAPPPARSAQVRAVGEARACGLEHVGRLRVQGQRLVEERFGVAGLGDYPQRPRRART